LSIKNKLIRECLLNLRLLVRKFPNGSSVLIDSLDLDQIIYLLKCVSLETSVKATLVDFFAEFLAINERRRLDFLLKLGDYLIDSFRMDAHTCDLNVAVYKFLGSLELKSHREDFIRAICSSLNNCLDQEALKGLIELNCQNLNAAGKSQLLLKNETFCRHLGELIDFLGNLLTQPCKDSAFEFVRGLLVWNESQIMKLCLDFLFISDTDESAMDVVAAADVKQLIYRFLARLNEAICCQIDTAELPAPLLILDTNVIQLVERSCCVESEAFVRREQLKLLSFYYTNQLKLSLRLAYEGEFSSLSLLNSLNRMSGILLTDLDWECQLNCLDYFQLVFDLIQSSMSDRIAPSTASNDRRSERFSVITTKVNNELNNFTLAEIVFCLSDVLKSLVGCYSSDYYDASVACAAAKLMLNLKASPAFSRLLPLLVGFNENFAFYKKNRDSNQKDTVAATDQKNLDGLEQEKDEENYLNKFLNEIPLEQLEKRVAEAHLTSDYYTRCPMSILDDIISSYQFEIDDEKAIDCY
jgi:hypothetical protein